MMKVSQLGEGVVSQLRTQQQHLINKMMIKVFIPRSMKPNFELSYDILVHFKIIGTSPLNVIWKDYKQPLL